MLKNIFLVTDEYGKQITDYQEFKHGKPYVTPSIKDALETAEKVSFREGCGMVIWQFNSIRGGMEWKPVKRIKKTAGKKIEFLPIDQWFS